MRLLHHFIEKVDLYLSDPALHGFRTNVWFCLLSLNQSSSQLVVDGCKWLWVLLAVMNSSYRTFFFFSPLELDLISVLGRQNLGLHAVYALLSEKTMAPHFSTLAWKIPWMEEPGGLQFMGSLRVGHEWATSFSLFTFTFHLHALEKEMATHSSIFAWEISWTNEPGRLESMESQKSWTWLNN